MKDIITYFTLILSFLTNYLPKPFLSLSSTTKDDRSPECPPVAICKIGCEEDEIELKGSRCPKKLKCCMGTGSIEPDGAFCNFVYSQHRIRVGKKRPSGRIELEECGEVAGEIIKLFNEQELQIRASEGEELKINEEEVVPISQKVYLETKARRDFQLSLNKWVTFLENNEQKKEVSSGRNIVSGIKINPLSLPPWVLGGKGIIFVNLSVDLSGIWRKSIVNSQKENFFQKFFSSMLGQSSSPDYFEYNISIETKTKNPYDFLGFKTCGSCSTCGFDPKYCILTDDSGACAKANQTPPCCVYWAGCGQRYSVCGDYRCDFNDPSKPCKRYDYFTNQCVFDLTCDNGKPFPPTLRTPNNAKLPFGSSVTLEWWAYKEGEDGRRGDCLPETSQNREPLMREDCWGWVCAKGSPGILPQWRYYEVYVREKNGPADFRRICRIENIPNPQKLGDGLGQGKTSCVFSFDPNDRTPRTYEWFVRAGYKVNTGFETHTDSEVREFSLAEDTSNCGLYNSNWVKITDFNTLSPNQNVFLATKAIPNATKAAFKINGLASPIWCNAQGLALINGWCETTLKHNDLFYIPLTIQKGIYQIESRVY